MELDRKRKGRLIVQTKTVIRKSEFQNLFSLGLDMCNFRQVNFRISVFTYKRERESKSYFIIVKTEADI